jgi:recombination protein RecT
MIQAAEMRLFPGVLQECAFVPYKNNKTGQMEAQFIPQYQGLSKLALQSRLVTRIVADVVYEKDEFDYCQGSETYLKHKRALTGRGKAIAAYCYVDFADGGSKFELLSYEDVERVRTRSKARDSSYSPWTTDWDEMAKKTAIKRCLKTVPKSFELAKAIDKDNRVENDDIQTPEFEELPPGVTPADPEDKTEAMKEKVEAAKKAKEEAPGPAPRDVETKLEVHPSAQDEFEALKEKMAAKKEKKDGK